MESPREAPEPAARNFSQVVFTDTPHSYLPFAPLTCSYTLTAAFQPSPRDWVGIFKVGWSTTKDYHTFVWVEPCLDVVGKESAARKAVFKEYYLPKDELDFYQFCYVDAAGQVRGASTPFCFKKPAEQSPESMAEEELLVITTQEQVEQSQREKAELQRELDQIRGENETLKNDRQMERRQAAGLKEQKEQKEEEMSQLVREMEQVKEQNEKLRSALQETERLKEEMMKQAEERQPDAAEEQQQSSSQDAASRQNEEQLQEKIDRSEVKISRLKEEREQLRGRVEDQSGDIAKLNYKIREQERELFKMKDGVQLLQVDLQSSEKEKERLSVELQRSQSLVNDMVEGRREDRQLEPSPTPQSGPDDDLKVECQTLGRQLQDAQRKLASEREETRNAKRRCDFLDNELRQLREQLEKVATSCEHAQGLSSKQELQIAELREVLSDKDGELEEKDQIVTLVTREKEALTRENQTLTGDMERLRRALDDLQAAPPTASTEPEVNPYESVGIPGDTEEETLVCRLCQESFPGITQDELEQHERSHRVCPYCPMSCDDMEQLVYEDHVYSHQL